MLESYIFRPNLCEVFA